MVRKQVAITLVQQQRIAALAACWHCADAEVIRRAIDQLPDPESPMHTRVGASGLLVPSAIEYDKELPTDEEIERLEAESDAWFASHPQAQGLSDAILEDRR